MRICPLCGAEVEDSATKCPICHVILPEESITSPEAPAPVQSLDLSAKLLEMRAKIEQLSPAPEETKPESKEEEVPSEKQIETAQIPEHPEEKATPSASEIVERPIELAEEAEEEEIEAEEEYEEIIVETRQIRESVIDRDAIVNLGKPKRKIEEAKGRKISLEEAKMAMKAHAGIRKSYIIAAIAIIAIVVIASFIFLINKPAIIIPAIDGVWDDWKSVSKYPAIIGSENPSLNIEETAVQYYKGSIFWYFRTTGELYKTSDRITSYALLIDSDGIPSTGFSLSQDFGADLMAMISGSGGEKILSVLYVYESEDCQNWSAWRNLRPLNIATLINRGETNFTAPAGFSIAEARFVSVAFDGKSETCMSTFFSLKPGVLVILQGSLIPPTAVLLAEPDQHLLQLIVRGYGMLGEVSSIIPTVEGADSADLGPITWLNADQMHTGKILTLSVDCSSIALGTRISATVEMDDVESDFGTVMVIGSPAVGYVGNIPSGITIDGIFADWSEFRLDLDDAVGPSNRDIDITKIATAASDTDLFFYGEVSGRIMNGSIVPVKETVAGPEGLVGPVEITERISGEDILQIYIDVDPFDDIGAPSPIPNATIEPDFMIELTGRSGMITHKIFYEWYDDKWIEDDLVEISAAIDRQRIELSIAKSSIGSLNGSDIAFVCTDWIGTRDDFSVASISVDPFKINLHGDVWGSLDGTSWVSRANVLNGTDSLIDLTSDASGNLYVVFSNGTVYVSYDLANSWSRLISGSLTNVVAITSDGVGQLYTITSSGNTYNATLSGGSWVYRGDITFASDVIDLDWSFGIIPESTCLYAVRSTPNMKIVQSMDGGASWLQYKNNPHTTSTVSAIAVLHSGDHDIIYILQTNGDIYVSNNTATTWEITHIAFGGSQDFVASPCVDLDIDSNGNLWVVRALGEVYRLITSTWTWEALYTINDVSDVSAISSVPIPEFSEFIPILLLCALILIIRARQITRSRKNP